MYWFGLRPDGDSRAIWGARAIDSMHASFRVDCGLQDPDRGTLSLLPDRQSFEGDAADLAALTALLNDCDILRRAQERWRELKAGGEVSGSEASRKTLFEGPLIRVDANTNGSHGYVYLAAWLKPAADLSELRRGLNEDGDAPVWSCDAAPPAVGDVVRLTSCWATDDAEPKMTVLGCTVEHAHLHVWGRLHNPRARWLDQCARGPWPPVWNIMGREWIPPSLRSRRAADGGV